MNYGLFGIENFNVIQDDEYYYVFRALNRADHEDIINEFLEHNRDLSRIRTDRERYEEQHGKAKYSKDSELTLEEMYDHIKMHYLKETNCISLSTNANVSLDYGSNYYDEYAMIKIPKKNQTKACYAGDYMLFEIFLKIEEALENKNINENIIHLVRKIDTLTSTNEIINLINTVAQETNYRKNILSRFQNRQYFNEEQQLEYNKLIAKASILEMTKILPSILEDNGDNQSLLATVGNAFSSGEVIHYKDIPQEDFKFLTKRMVNVLSLIQQLKEKHPENKDVIELEKRVIQLCNDGYDIKDVEGQVVLTNGEHIIDCFQSTKNSTIFKNLSMEESTTSLEEMFNMTGGTIGYSKAKKTVEFCYALSKSRRETYDYANVISIILGNNNLFEPIINETLIVNPEIIDRGNNNGFKLCESVNIGMNNEKNSFYTIKEQKAFVDLILGLDLNSIDKMLVDQGVVLRNSILNNIPRGNPTSKNEYYANAIIDSINFDKIYAPNMDEERRNGEILKLQQSLSAANVSRLYSAFEKLNKSHEEISYYIFNLLIEKSFKGHTFEELCELENIDEFVKTNFTVFNTKVNELTLNNYLGIFDDVNYIGDSNLSLRDFQKRIKDDVDKIYESGRRFAGVVLPTGGGKSFIAMAEMLERKDEKIVYLAPRLGILRNFKKNIVKYIAGLDPEGLDDSQLDAIVKDCFPHLELICYQSLDPRDEEKLENFNADFIIMDEIHHIGGASWNRVVKKLVDKNPNSKVLGISATPQRDDYKEYEGDDYFDMYGGNMMMAMAAYLDDYTPTELMQKRYLACDIDVIDAIQEGYLVCPNIVSFDYSLDETTEYNKTLKLVNKIKNPEAKRAAREEVEKMLTLVSQAKLKGVPEIIGEHTQVKDGKYILFIPRKPQTYAGTTDDYFQECIENFKTTIYNIDSDPHIEYIHSGRGDKVNSAVMQRFEVDNSDHMKVLVAVDMLNEGIHLPNLNGSFNFRKIDKNHLILALQHLGRVIYAVDPNKELTESDIPVVFDKYNIYSNLDMDRIVNKKSITSDLEKLKSALFWIDKYGRIPNAESSNTQEVRKALTLKRIIEKYSKFKGANLDDYSMSDYDKYNTEQIIRLCDENAIWDLNYGNISREKARELERVELFNVSATKDSFLEICNKVKDIAGVSSLTNYERLELIMNILDILTENDIIISTDNITEETLLKDFLANVDKDVVEDIMIEIKKLGVGLSYQFGSEFYNARANFYSNYSLFHNFNYNLEDITRLRRNGILSNGKDFKFIDDNGFVINGPNRLIRKNIWTGTYYSKNNCTIEGYDPYDFYIETGINRQTDDKYNMDGFDINHIHRITNTPYDPHGFDINRLHKDTLTPYNKRGFDIQGYWHKFDSNTNEINEKPSGRYDFQGFDINGYNRDGFDRNGIHRVTNEQYDELFFDKDGFYWELGADGQRRKTDRQINENNIDRRGNRYVRDKDGKLKKEGQVYDKYGFLPNGIHHRTHTICDENGYDINGIWYRKINGEFYSTGSIFNDKGWTRDNLTLRHNVYGVPYNDDGSLFLDFVDDYGFDIYGRYHYPESEIDSNGFTEFQGGLVKYSDRIMYKNKVGGQFYDVHHFNQKGINSRTGTHLNKDNFDRNGYWWKEDENGNLYNTYSYFNDDGWTIDRRTFIQGKVYSPINERGFNFDHFYKPSSSYPNNKRYDPYGFDYYGIHELTGTNLDEENFDLEGNWWKENEDGILINTKNRYNDDGWSREKTHITTGRIIDNHGFNYLHLYMYPSNGKSEARLSEYDPHGFDYTGIHKTTGKVYNAHHFDIDGYWYKKVDGVYVKTNQKYDDKGLNIDREDPNQFTKNGYFRHGRKKVNERGFDVNGIHYKTNQPYDLKGRNMAGELDEHADWDLINAIIKKEKFDRRELIEDIIEFFDETGRYEYLLESYDEYTGELEADESYIREFVDYVLENGIKPNEELYTEEEIMEHIIRDAERRIMRERQEEIYSIYRNNDLRKMIDEGEFTYSDEEDIYRFS